jgi:phage baseplate assembly protein W
MWEGGKLRSVQPTWQILPDPFTGDIITDSEDVPETGRVVGPSLFGRGLLRPLRRDGKGDFESGDGARLVRAAVGLVLGTVCSSDTTLGELPWRTEFGSLLMLVRLRNMGPALGDIARHYIVDALARWIPSVRIRAVEVQAGTRRRDELRLKVVYDVVDPSGARVLVPGLETSIPLG